LNSLGAGVFLLCERPFLLRIIRSGQDNQSKSVLVVGSNLPVG
jgi:hypothetical protein